MSKILSNENNYSKRLLLTRLEITRGSYPCQVLRNINSYCSYLNNASRYMRRHSIPTRMMQQGSLFCLNFMFVNTSWSIRFFLVISSFFFLFSFPFLLSYCFMPADVSLFLRMHGEKNLSFLMVFENYDLQFPPQNKMMEQEKWVNFQWQRWSRWWYYDEQYKHCCYYHLCCYCSLRYEHE